MNYLGVDQMEVVAALEKQAVQLKLGGIMNAHVVQDHRYLLTPAQARELAATLTNFARLVEQPREC